MDTTNLKNFPKYLFAAGGAIGVLAFIREVRAHYYRLNKHKAIIQDNVSSFTLTNKSTRTSEKKDITEQTFEILVGKIKNELIHTVCICIDKMRPAQAEVDDIFIGEDAAIDNEYGEILTNKTIDKFLPNFEKTMFSLNRINVGASVINSMEVTNFLINSEIKLIKTFGLSVNQYRNKLKKYLATNE